MNTTANVARKRIKYMIGKIIILFRILFKHYLWYEGRRCCVTHLLNSSWKSEGEAGCA